jgi:hypothetical protein
VYSLRWDSWSVQAEKFNQYTRILCFIDDRAKIHPRTRHQGPEGEYNYISNLSLTSALVVDWWSTPRPGNHYAGGWMHPKARLNRAENLAPIGIRSPDRPARSESLYRLS